jgi:AraC-like DNA-binding protein
MVSSMPRGDARRIGQTRRLSASRHGILRPAAESTHFHLERLEPSEDLKPIVDRHWIVRWDLRGREPYRQETLPHPCVNLAIQAGKSAIYGIGRRRFTVMLEGRDEVVGTKFRPGTFGAFLEEPIATLTGRAIPVDAVFGRHAGSRLERDMRRAGNAKGKVALLEACIRAARPCLDEAAIATRDATELALGCQEITAVEDLAERVGQSVRALQRAFHRHVGVSPKWVIRRARVQEAAERVALGQRVAWASLANELGYFDQAHLIRDFRAQIGETPAAYAATCARYAEERARQ